jgi:hypothetical protein
MPLGPRAKVMAMLLVNGGEINGRTGIALKNHLMGRGRFIRVTANAKDKAQQYPGQGYCQSQIQAVEHGGPSYQLVKMRVQAGNTEIAVGIKRDLQQTGERV